MNAPEYDSKLRSKEIAENEATRSLFSEIRVSTWAVLGCVLGVLIVLFFYLAR